MSGDLATSPVGSWARPIAARVLPRLAEPLAAVMIAFVLGGLLVLLLGYNPLLVYATLLRGSLIGWPNVLATLQMMSPLLFTGLAVSLSLRAGLINVGAEGQMLIGGLCAGVVGYAVRLPAPLAAPTCLVAAMLGGALWAALPAWLRVSYSVSELVVCLMMNPIAKLLTSYLATRPLKAPGPTNKLPDISAAAGLTNFSIFAQVNTGLLIGLLLCGAFAVVNLRTRPGLEWKLMGLNARFAHYSGIQVRRRAVAIMLISGAVAGLAGAEQVLGEYHAFYDSFSPGYGFDGIAVAMLAKLNPIGVIFAAFLFGALNSGGDVLQMLTGVDKDLVRVLQFIIVLVLSARPSWRWYKAWREASRP